MKSFIRKYRAELIALSLVALFWAGVWAYQQYDLASTLQSPTDRQAQLLEEGGPAIP